METKIALFRGSGIRKTLHNNEWWFVVEDVVSALIDSKDPKQYIQRFDESRYRQILKAYRKKSPEEIPKALEKEFNDNQHRSDLH